MAALVNNGILTIPIGREDLDINLDRLFADAVPGEDHVDFPFAIQLLMDEQPPAKFWCVIANHCWSSGHRAEAEEVCRRGIEIAQYARPGSGLNKADIIPFQSMLASMTLARGRGAPAELLKDARYKVFDPQQDPPKARYYQEADRLLRGAEQIQNEMPKNEHYMELLHLSRGIQDLTAGSHDSAMKHFNRVLDRHPQHTVALLGKGCLLLRLKSYSQALKVYQQLLEAVLLLNYVGDSRWQGPDPRIGIGLAFWGLGRMEEARRAWRRALALNPDSHSALTLLGLSSLHLHKMAQPLPGDEDVLRKQLYAEGTSQLSRAFKLDNRNSILAAALCEHFIEKASVLIESGFITSVADPQWATIRDLLMRALKLGEHAIQYGEVARAGIQAKLQFARALHIISYLPGGEIALRTVASRYYNMVLDETSRGAKAQVAARYLMPAEALAAVGLAQIQISANNYANAVETLSKFQGKAHSSGSIALEILLLSASVKLKQHPEGALAMLERAVKMIEAAKRQSERLVGTETGEEDIYTASSDFTRSTLAPEGLGLDALQSIASVGSDPFIFVELAGLVQHSDPSLAARCYRAALAAVTANGRTLTARDNLLAMRCRSNIGGLYAIQATDSSDLALMDQAVAELQAVLLSASKIAPGSPESAAAEAVRIIATYNLGRVSELADSNRAIEAYQAVLNAHPEYVDAKTRLALLHVTEDRKDKETALTLLKEALSSDITNLDTRIVYAALLAGELPGAPSAHWLEARDFLADVFKGATDLGAKSFGSKQIAGEVQDRARKDAPSLATLGWAYYQVLISSKPGPNAKADRNKAMYRAFDLFDKALSADPKCAFAAQGMAILLAEDALADANVDKSAPVAIAQAAQDQRAYERRKRSADDAIAILTKLREIREEGSVHVCLGNAFMIKEEYERAVKAFEFASTRFYPEGKVTMFQNLARAEYALGVAKRIPTSLETSIEYLERAAKRLETYENSNAKLELQWIRFNQAVTRQKLLQMLLDLAPEKRTKDQIEKAIEGHNHAIQALKELLPLAGNRQLMHITADIIEQRIQYGENSLVSQGASMLEEQVEHEQSMEQAQQEALAILQAKEEQRKLQEKEKLEAERERNERLQARRAAAREKLNEVNWSVLNTVEEKKQPKKSGKSRRKKGGDDEDDDDLGIVPDENEQDDEAAFSDEGNAEARAEANRRDALRKLKRKKSKGSRRRKDSSESEMSEADGSDSDAPAKKKKKGRVSKKRKAVEDDDDDRISSDEEV